MKINWEVRKGFLVGALAGFFAVGTGIWAIPVVSPYMPGHYNEPVIQPHSFMPIVRDAMPQELTWFYIQYPYLSATSSSRKKDNHSFVISDALRKREYVVSFGQRYRRVEIYSGDSKDVQVHVYTPGSKRQVLFQNGLIVSQSQTTEPNLWMWKYPLWNKKHLEIYSKADLWLDSPYKKYSCAGFVSRYLKEVDVRVPVLDAWDMAKLPWVRVPRDEMEPGDIITLRANSEEHRRFWGHRITHVGVYIGNGKFIHASTAHRKARRSYIRVAEVQDFKHRVDKVIRPPDLL